MRPPLLALALIVIAAHPAAAQWTTSARVVRAGTSGYLTSTDDLDFRPHSPLEYSLAIGRQLGPWEFRVVGRRVKAALLVGDDELSLVSRDAIRARGGAVELLRRVAGDGIGTTLHMGVGGELLRWTIAEIADDPRWEMAVSGALEGSAPIGAGFRVMLRGEVMAGPSIFRGSDLEPDFTRTTAVRHGVAFGILRRW